ncbi:MAG: NUDIX domain-containing protein [Nanoarchaeota archaeon]
MIINDSDRNGLSKVNIGEIGTFHHFPGSSVELHYHDADELWYITKGRATIISDLIVSSVGKGDLIYTPAGNEHAVIDVSDDLEGVFISGTPQGSRKIGHLHHEYGIKNAIIFGKSGSNKKNFIQNYLLGIREPCIIIILDRKNEFEIGKNIGPSVKNLFPGIYKIPNCTTPAEAVEELLKGNRGDYPLMFVSYAFDNDFFQFASRHNSKDTFFFLSTENREIFNLKTHFSKIHIRNIAIEIFYTDDGRLLFQERGLHSKFGEKWSFFGGSLEPGESPDACIRREIKEELNFELRDHEFIRQFYELVNGSIFLNVFIFACKIDDNTKFQLGEGLSHKLFKTSELTSIELGPVDNKIIEILRKWKEK